MILLSNSMPKTGSTIMATYQERLLELAGCRSGQCRLKRGFGGRYIDAPTRKNLLKLIYINSRFGSSVVKNHWDYSEEIKFLAKTRLAKVTMCFRDPRDIILSILDHGKRSRDSGIMSGHFSEYTNVKDTFPYVKRLVEKFDKWKNIGNVFYVKYEDMMSSPVDILEEMAKFLEWSVPNDSIRELIDQLELKKTKSHNFNKGTVERWKDEMSKNDIEMTTNAFNEFLSSHAYEH